jgi:hypothetical protein
MGKELDSKVSMTRPADKGVRHDALDLLNRS